jgi:hypothetical protein
VTSTAKTEGSRRRVAFRWIALAFAALLAFGFALALVVHDRFVAYQPLAARHTPKDATFVARFDLTHVMLYEPFRRYVFPVVDLGAEGRRERLGEEGLQIGGEVREVVIAFGNDASDWSVALGGPLSENQISDTLARVLRAENRRVDGHGGLFTVGGGRMAFGQAKDGALVLASSEARLRAALPRSAEPAPLGQGAGGLRVSGTWLPTEIQRLEGSYRAGSVVLVELVAETTAGTTPDAAEAALRSVLGRVAGSDPELTAAARSAVFRATPGRVSAQVTLSNTAVERLAARALDALGLPAVEVGARAP